MTTVIIRLQNLPMSANTSSIRRFFSGLNIPEGGVHIVGGDDGDAFIAFATDEDARKAMLLDRQSINAATIRLFLSSKTEMQSVIETARSSIMLPPLVSSQQLPSLKTNQEHPQFAEKPTVSEYQSNIDQINSKSLHTDPYMQYSFHATDSTLNNSINTYTEIPHISKIQPTTFIPEQTSTFRDSYNYQYDGNFDRSRDDRIIPPPFNPQSSVPIHKNELPSIHDYNNTVERMNASSLPYCQSSSLPQSKLDYGYQNYVDSFNTNRPLETKNRPELNNAVPFVPIRFEGDPSFTQNNFPIKNRITDEYHRIDSDSFGKARPYLYDQYPRDFPRNQERDFSVRPPWLGDDAQHLKRLSDVDEHAHRDDIQEPKRNKIIPDEIAQDTNFVCKLSLRPSDVSVKAVFDILKGVNIIPRWGIRVEEDILKRFTGHIYAMISSRENLERALNCNGFNYRGRAVEVVASTPDEFFRVTDSNFPSKCPPDVLKKLPPRSATKPPFYADACVELADLPSDVTKEEIVSFLGAPGLSVFDVVIVHGKPSGPNTIAVVHLPSSNDLDILLRARPRPFREDLGVAMRLTPISRMQYLAAETKTSGVSPVGQIESIKDVKNIRSSELPSTTEAKSCAFLSGFTRQMTNFEISKLFPSVIIPGDAIRILDGNKSSLIDFISENNCLKAVSDFKSMEAKLKEIHPSLSINTLSRSEFEKRIHESTIADESEHYGMRQRAQPTFNDLDNREFRQPPRENIRFPLRHPPPNTPEYVRYNHPPSQRPPFFDDQPVRSPSYPETYPRRPEPFAATRPPRMPHPSMPPIPRPDLPRGINVYISNLLPMASPEIIIDVFRQYHPIPGSLRLRRDTHGQPMGEAVISFSSSVDADRAIRELNGYRIYGRNMVLRHERDSGRCD